MLIDSTYFTGTGIFYIPNIDECNETNAGNLSELNSYINAFEPEICGKIIGKTLYDSLIAGLAQPSPEAHWTALRDKLINSTALTSPIANYIYFKLWQKSQAIKTDSGDAVLTGASLLVTGNIPHAVMVNNQMVDMIMTFWDWFEDNLATYPEYDASEPKTWSIYDKINICGL